MAEIGDSIRVDSAGVDSAAMDTAVYDTTYAIVLERPDAPPMPRWKEPGYGMSWVVAALMATLFVAAVKYRDNPRYPRMLLADMWEVRERRNAFDNTARESTFLALLNLLWCISSGVLLGALAGSTAWTGYAVGALCMGAYTLFMSAAYYIVGIVFSDRRHAAVWVSGFSSGQAFGAVPVSLLALLQIIYPDQGRVWLICAGVVCAMLKIVFLCKGFRIFFTRIASWVLFLYYLCSLEIIPLILTYVAAQLLCANLL